MKILSTPIFWKVVHKYLWIPTTIITCNVTQYFQVWCIWCIHVCVCGCQQTKQLPDNYTALVREQWWFWLQLYADHVFYYTGTEWHHPPSAANHPLSSTTPLSQPKCNENDCNQTSRIKILIPIFCHNKKLSIISVSNPHHNTIC